MKVEKASIDQVKNKIVSVLAAEEEEQNLANSAIGGVPSLAAAATSVKSVTSAPVVKKRVTYKDKEEGVYVYLSTYLFI
jgi:hypothetical protein